ncbi:MAG TPA: hypothetical protein VMU34_20470 [Mycobacterium sp.]|nr:hypothetical protein [Mycobacterium sp.]
MVLAKSRVIERRAVESLSTSMTESVITQAIEKLFAGRFDRLICAGATARPARAFTLHVRRVTNTAQRQRLASRLSAVLIDARCGRVRVTPRLPLDRSAVVAAAELIGQVMARLQAPGPVDARGVAHLRLLISQAGGPLYRYGHGDLSQELHTVLTLL